LTIIYHNISLIDFFDKRLPLTRKLLNLGSLMVKMRSSIRMSYNLGYDLCDLYRIYAYICVTDNHGYIVFDVDLITSFFPLSILTTECVRRVPLAEQKQRNLFRSTQAHSLLLVRFMSLYP
jgi:hypothetical protein